MNGYYVFSEVKELRSISMFEKWIMNEMLILWINSFVNYVEGYRYGRQ